MDKSIIRINDTKYNIKDAVARAQAEAAGVLPYGYDPFTGTVSQANICQLTVNRAGPRVAINGSYTTGGTAAKLVLSLPEPVSYTSTRPDSVKANGLILQNGHTYRIRCHQVSGSASNSIGMRFINVSDGTLVGTASGDPLTGDRICTLDYLSTDYPDGVHIALVVTRSSTGNTLWNYTADVTLEDITFGGQEMPHKNLAPIESDTVSQGYTVGKLLVWKGQLYEVTAPIASGESLAVGTNIKVTSIYEQLAAIRALLN